MKTTKPYKLISCAAFVAGALSLALPALTGCKQEETAAEPPVQSQPPAALADRITTTAPPDAISVVEARKQPTPGREIVLKGFVGGRAKPFVDDRAVLVLADPDALATCDKRPDDNCKTPWDACCEDPDTIRGAIATVQVTDKDGRVIPHSLRNLNGITAGKPLIVKGVVAEGSGPEALIVNAEKIHVPNP